MQIPGLGNAFFQGKWLLQDGLKSRQGLLIGYKIAIIVVLVSGLWQIAGAYIILGNPFQTYILKNYPWWFGYNDDGKCVGTGCSPTVPLSDAIKYHAAAEVGGTVAVTIITALFNFYYLTQAKRLVALWG